jgi:hypothetical protein
MYTKCGKLKDGVLDLIVPHNVQRFEICSLPIAITMNKMVKQILLN